MSESEFTPVTGEGTEVKKSNTFKKGLMKVVEYENLYESEERENGITQKERERRIKICLNEIEQAIKAEFMVEDVNDKDSVYMVASDFKEGEYVSVPKYDVAQMFIDDSELYSTWKDAYMAYLKKREARNSIKPIFGFSQKNGGTT